MLVQLAERALLNVLTPAHGHIYHRPYNPGMTDEQIAIEKLQRALEILQLTTEELDAEVVVKSSSCHGAILDRCVQVGDHSRQALINMYNAKLPHTDNVDWHDFVQHTIYYTLSSIYCIQAIMAS